MRLVYVTTSPIPYVTPILNSLARLTDLHVVYLARVETTYNFRDAWGVEPDFAHSFLKRSLTNRPIKLSRVDLLTYVSFGVSTELDRLESDIVSVTSWGPQTIEPVTWARRKGRAVVLWSESTAWSGLLRDPLSSAARRWCVGRADAFLSNGSQASEYLRHLGAPSDAVVTSRLPSHLTAGVDPRSGPSSGGPHFLFVGRLTARKRPVEVVQAFGLARTRLARSTLTIVGDGPLMSDVRAAARRVGESVRVLGRREGRELQETYRQCDVLVLPAKREVWGLVVNEALAHGLFVIASDEVGSAYDLITPETGVVLPAGDVRGLPAALVATEGVDPSDAARHRRAEAVTGCTPEGMAIDWARAAELSVERSARRRVVPRNRRAHGAGEGAATSTDSSDSARRYRQWQS